MKDTLILEHKIFISAKRAVQISGYTSDYIGQLCRAGKLDCKMVGKSWFLTEESLQNYRLSTKQESVLEDKPNTSQNSSTTPVTSDSVILDRMNFISAKRAAEISGYTPDYVGQLCRLGKLESRRVGKAWFVSEKSLLNHCVSIAQEQEMHHTEKRDTMQVQTTPIHLPLTQVSVSAPVKSSEVIYPKKVTFDNLREKSNVLSVAQFSRISILFVILLIVALFLFQYLFTSRIFTTTSTPKLTANLFSGDVQQAVVKDVEKSPPIFNGVAVIPSSGSVSQDEVLKEKIQDSFSDEVLVKPDKSGTTGVITPIFKKTKGNDFVYVMVPVKN
jgi:hypothetical protein